MIIDIPYYEDNTRISNSAIGWFLNKGPAYFHNKLSGLVEDEKTSAMDKGTMIHMYLLQPHEFKEHYKVWTHNRPSSTNQEKFVQALVDSVEIEPDKAIISAYKSAYSTSNLSDDKVLQKAKEVANSLSEYISHMREKSKTETLISMSDYVKVNHIYENIQSHKLAKELLEPTCGKTFHEFHINWDYNGLPCKSLLDSVNFDYDAHICTIMDLKTTVKIGHFEDSVNQYDYTRQLMFYTEAVRWYIKNELHEDPYSWEFKWYIIAIDTVSDGEIRVFKFDYSQLILAGAKIESAINDIKWHFDNNLWDYRREYYEGDGAESLNL